jgi:hypothetical protein
MQCSAHIDGEQNQAQVDIDRTYSVTEYSEMKVWMATLRALKQDKYIV